MNKLFKSCVSSMNYFFLKETFRDESIMNGYVLSELGIFLDELLDHSTPEIDEIIECELYEGDYIDGMSLEEVRSRLEGSVIKIMEYECNEVVDKYMNIADKVMKRYALEESNSR